ncbi:histidine kinase [Agarilytica rhodophyticola]|uniref:histidine kinase n=1 Tax=Agarilytica rhodophyticola TaxID=1737490 RepID=UPI000B345128|nr:histidine kinase [Agarilytica rhodophyticola]
MPLLQINEDHRDALQEITNVAMGQAGDKLARLLDTFVVLSIPHIEVMKPSDIAMALHAIDSNQSVSGVCQGFIGGGIAGEAMLLFNDTSFADLAKLLDYKEHLDEQAERELLMDTTNVLFGACLQGISEQIDMDFSFGSPTVLGQHQKVSDIFDMANTKWESALVTEISYELEGYNVNCDLLIIMTADSLDLLFKKLDYLIA